MKKIAVLCKDGFEEIEALTPVDVLRRANVHVDLVGMDDLKVTSSHQITIQMDCVFNDQIKEYDGIVIPGGLPGATNLRDDARVIEIVQQFNLEHKLIAAICAGPIVLQVLKHNLPELIIKKLLFKKMIILLQVKDQRLP